MQTIKHFKKEWIKPPVRAAQIKLLEKLSNAIAVSGDESSVREIVYQEIQHITDHLKIDALGNVLAIKRGKGKILPRVMLSAHMDEVGFMLTHDEGKGIFRFKIVGGIDPRHLAGKPVWVGQDKLPGVIGIGPIHLASDYESANAVSDKNLRIDIGPSNSGKVKIGDRAVFASNFTRIGPSLRGKALDDRIGVATLITLLKHAPENIDLLAAFTVQEEVGLRGAKVAAHALDPDMGFALDCTPAMDMPVWNGTENIQYRSRLDQGPAIYVGDGSTLSDPRLVQLLRETGDHYQIPYQIRQPGGGGTDAGGIHLSRAGIPAVSLSVPGRYLHTPASIVRLKDWQNSIYLLHAALSQIDSQLLDNPR